MTKQVDKEAYHFDKYCGLDRWSSYYYQLREILLLEPTSVLEVGVGDRVVGNYLKNNTSVSYRSFDIAEDLTPDIVGSVESIDLPDHSVDVVVAFEVLEHLPFEKFEGALKELGRVATKAVIISLPHYGPSVRCSLKIPFLKKIFKKEDVRFAWKIPHHPVHTWNGQHHWEIGKRGYNIEKIRKVIEKHFIIEKEFVPFENQYHHFFILRFRV